MKLSNKKKIKALEASPSEDLSGEKGDATVTKREMVEALKKQRAELTGDYEKDKKESKKEQREAFIDKSFEKARDTMTEAKMGKGLDFDTVWAACQKVIAKEPGYKAVISTSKNPGAKAYEIGLLDPEIAKLSALQKKTI